MEKKLKRQQRKLSRRVLLAKQRRINLFESKNYQKQDAGVIVARIIDKNLKESIVSTEHLTPQPLYPIGSLCINVITGAKCYLIEYGQNDKATVARVCYLDGSGEVIYAHQLYGIPIFPPGRCVTTQSGEQKRVEEAGIAPGGKLVYRLSDVYFADIITDII